MARIKIKKVAATRLSPITGNIVNGTNFVDKVHNTYSANTIDGLVKEVYSTEEHFTGRYWIDGKKIYGKTVFSTLPTVSEFKKDIFLNNENVALMLPITGGVPRSTGLNIDLTIPYINIKDSVSIYAYYDADQNKVVTESNVGFVVNKTFYLNLEYTKTTD